MHGHFSGLQLVHPVKAPSYAPLLAVLCVDQVEQKVDSTGCMHDYTYVTQVSCLVLVHETETVCKY